MDRSREARRATIVGSNGFNRRRHRTSSFRDSPDEDGEVELQESVRLRDRVVKKDRDRERERDLRERSNRSKRRRAGDETSDESVNEDDEEGEDEENADTPSGRLAPPPLVSISIHHHHHHSNLHLQQNGKTYSPSPGSSAPKVFRSLTVWKSGDEMIGVPVPRKARSASTKRSHDWISSGSNNNSSGEQNHRPESTPALTVSPSSSNASVGKKLKTGVKSGGAPKSKPPKAAQKPISSNPEELEIEIAEVLYGMKTQSQGRSPKPRNSSPVSVTDSPNNPSNFGRLSVAAPKRKRPRQVPDFSSHGGAVSSNPPLKTEVTSPAVGNGEMPELAEAKPPESNRSDSDFNSRERRDFAVKGEVSSSKEKENDERIIVKDLPSTATSLPAAPEAKSNSVASENETPTDVKLEIDLMAPPPAREGVDAAIAVNPKLVLSIGTAALTAMDSSKDDENLVAEEENGRRATEEDESSQVVGNQSRIIDLQLDLEKLAREEANSFRRKPEKQTQPPEKGALAPLPPSIPGWPPMGYMAPLQSVVSMDGNAVQPPFSQPRPKRCATHWHIAKNIHFLQQFMRMSSPFWTGGSPGATPLFTSKSLPDVQGNLSLRGDKEQTGQGLSSDSSSRKQQQIVIQQALPPGNLLGPAFIFPLNQQLSGAAVGARPTAAKSSITASTSAVAMNYSYPANESQYLAILPNNGYPFPVPGVGAPSSYVGAPPPTMSFYSSQMLHPSQLPGTQVAQLLQPPLPSGSAASNGSSSSQKLRLQNAGNFVGQYVQAPLGGGDGASTNDSRGTRGGPMNIYGGLPNFTLMAPSPVAATPATTNNSQLEKKGNQPQPASFAVSFGSISNGTTAIDLASVAQNHVVFHSPVPSENARHSIQMMAAVKSTGPDSSAAGDDKKLGHGKAPGVNQSPVQANVVVDSSGRSLVSSSTSRSSLTSPAAPVSRNKSPLSSSGSMYSEHPAKLPAMALVGFPQNLVPRNTASPNHQSPQQWKGSSRASTSHSQAPQPSLAAAASMAPSPPNWKGSQVASSTAAAATSSQLNTWPRASMLTNLRAAPTPVHTQISFGGNPKTWSNLQGQAAPAAATDSSKIGQASWPPSSVHQLKNSGSAASQKPAVASSSAIPGAAIPKAQLFFSNPYTQQSQSHHSSSSSTSSPGGGYFATKKRPEHSQTPQATSGMLSLSTPVATTSDPAKTIAANNVKGAASLLPAGAVLPARFSYLHPVPAAVQVKPAEQKQPAG